jgi:hypothetical protein
MLTDELRSKLKLDDPGFLTNAHIWKSPDAARYQAAWDAVVNA